MLRAAVVLAIIAAVSAGRKYDHYNNYDNYDNDRNYNYLRRTVGVSGAGFRNLWNSRRPYSRGYGSYGSYGSYGRGYNYDNDFYSDTALTGDMYPTYAGFEGYYGSNGIQGYVDNTGYLSRPMLSYYNRLARAENMRFGNRFDGYYNSGSRHYPGSRHYSRKGSYNKVY